MLRRFSFSKRSSICGSSSLHESGSSSSTNIFKDDTWKKLKVDKNALYKPEGKFFTKSDYVIGSVEDAVHVNSSEEEFYLLSHGSIIKYHKQSYKFLHFGCVQVAIKPLFMEGLNVSCQVCLRDARHKLFSESLLGTIEASLHAGPIYFCAYPKLTISLMDENIMDALKLSIKLQGFDMNPGSTPVALLYRIQYKVMNSWNSRVIIPRQDGNYSTVILTDRAKANVIIPKTIQWKDVHLPEEWIMENVTIVCADEEC